jgi:hypothetical protein
MTTTAAAPAGAHILLALDDTGEVRAQYAGVRQLIHSELGPLHFAQSIDSFAAPRQDAGLARSSAFVRAGEAYLQHFCGPGPEQDQVVFGLANPAAWRSGARRLGYEHVRTQMLLAAQVEQLTQLAADGLVVQSAARAPADCDALCTRAAVGRRTAGLRDRAWLDWRFSQRPGERYEFGVVREREELRGVGIFRLGRFAEREGGLLCDWIVPAEDGDAQRALLGWFAQRARASGARELLALCADCAPEWLEFQRLGFRVQPSEYVLAARSFLPALEREFLFRNWCYTLADTDLV